MDTLCAPIYDENWGASIDPLHRTMAEHFLALCPQGAQILDAARGTGKYWPLLLGHGRGVLGIDQSGGMLRRAHAKFPEVPVEKLGLQELAYEHRFDGITCIDPMELVFPEEWPRVLLNFHRALKPNGLRYFTVELPEEDLPEVFQAALRAQFPVVKGEYVKDGTYHNYPGMEQVQAWADTSGFRIMHQAADDVYHHFIVHKRPE